MARKITDRFWAKVNKTTTCWLWTGSRNDRGYGFFSNGKRTVKAHRFAYESTGAKIPHGLVIDHVCRTPSCVRPDHLEAVTRRVNILRGIGPTAINARKATCVNGHTFDRVYAYRRDCSACKRERYQQVYRFKK